MRDKDVHDILAPLLPLHVARRRHVGADAAGAPGRRARGRACAPRPSGWASATLAGGGGRRSASRRRPGAGVRRPRVRGRLDLPGRSAARAPAVARGRGRARRRHDDARTAALCLACLLRASAAAAPQQLQPPNAQQPPPPADAAPPDPAADAPPPDPSTPLAKLLNAALGQVRARGQRAAPHRHRRAPAAEQHDQVLRRRGGHLLRREPARGARQRRLLRARRPHRRRARRVRPRQGHRRRSTTPPASWRWASSPTRGQFAGQDPDVYFYGETIEKLPNRKYRITKGAFTTCVQPTPRWELTSGSVDITLDDYAFARGTVLRVKGVPVLYLPVIYYPLQDEPARHRLPAADLRHVHLSRPGDQQRLLLGDRTAATT